MIDETKKQEYFEFLDELRESGETNMLEARPYLQRMFPELRPVDAGKILTEWTKRK